MLMPGLGGNEVTIPRGGSIVVLTRDVASDGSSIHAYRSFFFHTCFFPPIPVIRCWWLTLH